MTLLSEIEHLILKQFARSKKLKALINASVRPFEEVYNHVEKLDEGRFVDQAEKYTLDVIGHIVDFPRDKRSDEDYRVWLKVAILLNCGRGRVIDLHRVLGALYGANKPPIEIRELGYGVMHINIYALPENTEWKVLKAIIERALPLGMRCTFGDARPIEPRLNPSVLTRSSNKSAPRFQLDTTAFDNSIFADFFKGEQYAKQ